MSFWKMVSLVASMYLVGAIVYVGILLGAVYFIVQFLKYLGVL